MSSRAIAFLAVLLYALVIDMGTTPFIERKKSGGVRKPLPARGAAVDSSSSRYPFKDIEKHLVLHREAIASCFWNTSRSVAGRYRLEFHFSANSKVEKVDVQPTTSQTPIACLQSLVSTWKLPPSRTARPFAYQTYLSL